MDVLETSLQPMIAQRHGFGPDGAGRLMEQFFKTVRDIRTILLAFLEKDSSGRNIWHDVRRRLSANHLGPGIAVLDGILFSTRSQESSIGTAFWSLGIFRYAILHKATLSVELRNRLHQIALHLDDKEFKSQSIGGIFREILESSAPIGQVMVMMHETGLLGRLIPQFTALTCKVEYDSYHEFTIDQHILQCLQAADALADDRDEKIRFLYSNMASPLILRLALLLHDIGKSRTGNHAHNGAIIAENVCERLGMNRDETKRICFLVYHHLDMSDLSLSREPEDHHIQEFATTLEDKEMLGLLYLLTIADIRSVGRRTWTEWKAFQLEQLYERTLSIFSRASEIIPSDTVKQVVKSDQEQLVSPLPSPLTIMDTSYLQDNTPEEQKKHLEWLTEVGGDNLRLHHEMFVGFEQLTVCGRDRIGFLSDIIGCISSEGYNILSARIYSTTDGKVLDIFNLEAPEKPRIAGTARIGNLYQKWRILSRGDVTADFLMQERILRYPPEPLRIASVAPTVNVNIDNAISRLYTIVEIDTVDNFGLLHKIARCFSENDINIIMARLSTRIDQAVDVFYVTDKGKMKITDLQKINRLKDDLIETIKYKEQSGTG
jgi:[protein-PII] uridylyltransferase